MTPVAYPASLVPSGWRIAYSVNPLVGVVEGTRWALLGTPGAPGAMLAVSALAAVTLLISGMVYFRRLESIFADVI
jgi:lipopolysaccharide transport system permease protein